jgi:hypothetical protein
VLRTAARLLACLAGDLIQPVLSPPPRQVKNYPKSPTYANLLPFIGAKSLLVADPATWRRHRSAFNPGFSYAFLKARRPRGLRGLQAGLAWRPGLAASMHAAPGPAWGCACSKCPRPSAAPGR